MGASVGNIVYLASTGLYYGAGYYSPDLINWYVLPLAPGQTQFTNTRQVTDGTRIFTYTGITYNPFYTYNTSTQFIVPNYGGNALGPSPVLGGYYNIKT
jgi:hypothetical protein